jgi:GNAT superfamily N-acetyltransferase
VSLVESLRYARPDEVHALEELQRRASMVFEEYHQRLAEFPDEVRISVAAVRDQRVRVAVGAGVALGFSTVMPVERRVSRLDALWVEPEWTGGGVGAALVDDAVAIAADEGIVRLEVVASERLAPFYESVGFRRRDPVDTWFGPAVSMVRDV